MNFAGCGQCHEPENKCGRMWLGEHAKEVNFAYFKKQIYQHLEKWPSGTMPTYSPDRLPEPVLLEIYKWMVEDLGVRPSITGALSVGERSGDKTTYTLLISNNGVKDTGLAAEGLTIFVRIPKGAKVVSGTGPGYASVMPLAPHAHDDTGHVERPVPDLSGDVAVWKAPRLDASQKFSLSLTLEGPAPTADLVKGFLGSTVYWASPGRRPAGSPPMMVYRDLRIPDKGDHEVISAPRVQ